MLVVKYRNKDGDMTENRDSEENLSKSDDVIMQQKLGLLGGIALVVGTIIGNV